MLLMMCFYLIMFVLMMCRLNFKKMEGENEIIESNTTYSPLFPKIDENIENNSDENNNEENNNFNNNNKEEEYEPIQFSPTRLRRSSSTSSINGRRRSETAIELANALRDESVKFIQRRRDDVDDRLIKIPLQEIRVVKSALIDTMVGRRKFHIAWTLWVVGFSAIGGGIIALLGKHSFVDSWFTAASAICNAGLSVMSPDGHPRGSLAIIAILMLLGGSSVMLLPTMIVRAYRLRKYRTQMKECLTTIQSSPSSWSFSELERIVDRNTYNSDLKNVLVIVADYYKLYDALIAAIWIVTLYTFLWIFFGAIFLYLGLLLRPMEPVLKDRGITTIENAIFLSISSFTNSGLTISPNSLFYVTNNDFVLFILSLLILVGNTLMPVLLRYFISFILWFIQRFILSSRNTNITSITTSNIPFASIDLENVNNSPSSPSNTNSPSNLNSTQNTMQSISMRVRYI